MRVEDLIAALQDRNPDAEVRFAYQPTYPLYEDVNDIAEPTKWFTFVLHEQNIKENDLTGTDIKPGWYVVDEEFELAAENFEEHWACDERTGEPHVFEDEDEAERWIEEQSEPFVYLYGGWSNGYLPGDVSRRIGWR